MEAEREALVYLQKFEEYENEKIVDWRFSHERNELHNLIHDLLNTIDEISN